LIHLLVEARGRPLAITATAANGDERRQVEKLLEQQSKLFESPCLSQRRMTILEADKGYDCQWLRQLLHEREIFPLIPKRRMGKLFSKNPKTIAICNFFQIKRMRWQVERTFSWLKRKCRRLFIRWEKRSDNWLAMLKLSLIDYWLEVFEG